MDGGQPDAAGAGLHEDRLAGVEAAELEQAVVGGAELDRHPGGLLGGEPVGDGVDDGGRHRHHLGVAAERHRGHHPLPDLQARHPTAQLTDPTGGLVADDVRRGDQLSAGAVEQIPTLDAHGIDIDQHPAVAQRRVRDVDVLEDLGSAGALVGSRFHRRDRTGTPVSPADPVATGPAVMPSHRCGRAARRGRRA